MQTGDDLYLDPCQWNGAPSTVTLAAGEIAAGVSIALVPASLLVITVSDPLKTLAQKTPDGRTPGLALGVRGPDGLYYGVLASYDSITGSCAHTDVTASVTGTITLIGVNSDVDGSDSSPPSTSVATSVTVGPGPIVTGLIDYTTGASCSFSQNPGCVLSVAQTDIIEIFGEGLNPAGGNMAEIASSSGQIWLSEADGLYFWDESRTQINAQLSCSAGLGASTLYVLSPNSGSAPSAGVSINVTAGSGCS